MTTTDKQPPNQPTRDEGGLFLPGNQQGFKRGQSGNPAGRPKKGDALADVIAKVMEQTERKFAGMPGKVSRRKVLVEMVHRFVSIALYDADHRVALAAAQWLADRGYGKARQSTDINLEGGLIGPVILPVLEKDCKVTPSPAGEGKPDNEE